MCMCVCVCLYDQDGQLERISDFFKYLLTASVCVALTRFGTKTSLFDRSFP